MFDDDDDFSLSPEDVKPLGEIFFLKPAKNSDNLYQAFASLSREFFNPQWIDLQGVKRLAVEKPGSVLIVDSIDSKQFSRVRKICRRKPSESVLRGFSLRIFTAFALLSINPRKIEYLPDAKYPMISTCMKSLRIATSGLGPKKAGEIRRTVISMGAISQHGLLRSTSVLVSTTWTSQKVMCLRMSELTLPVVTPEWVARCYDLREDIKDAKTIIDKYRLPTFQGMHFCVTGFATDARSKICRVVQDEGGTYSQGLSLAKYKFNGQIVEHQPTPNSIPYTTHLIVAQKSGVKYECAMELSEKEIHIVNYEWFLVSRTKGFPQVESDPRYNARDPEVMEQLKRKELEKKQKAVLSSSLTTTDTPRTQNISSSQELAKIPPSVNPLVEIEKLLCATSSPKIFPELSFFICGLNTIGYLNVKKLVSRAGGTVYTNLVAAVTHVIIGSNMTSKEALSIKRHDEKVRPVAKVDVEWVVLCVKERRLLCESIDEASSKLLGRINSTQDLDPDDKMQVIRARGESKASVMDIKLRELEETSGNRVPHTTKKGLRMGDITQHGPLRLTKKSADDTIPFSLPVDYDFDSPDC